MLNNSNQSFYLEYGPRKLLCYAFSSSKNRRVTLKVFYGCCFFYIPYRVLIRNYGTDDINHIVSSEKLFGSFKLFLCSFLNDTDAIRKFERKGVYLQSNMYISPEYCYILGEKKTVSIGKENSSSGISSSSYESLNKMYREMALFHFEKRVKDLCVTMDIKKVPSVGISNAVDYLGLNNGRNNKVLFNEALYAFKPEVGDAVIVHELSHCFIRNHSKDFYDIVLKYCPDYYRYEKIVLSGMFEQK